MGHGYSSSLNTEGLQDSRFNPYATTYGRFVNLGSTMSDLLKFHTTEVFRQDPYQYALSYDITMGDFIPVVITGKSDEERNIPPFALPLLYKNHKDDLCVAIDIREYVNKPSPSIKTYQDLMACVGRHSNVEFLFRLANCMCSLASGHYSDVPFRDAMRAYVFVYTTIIKNIINLDVEEEDRVRVCLGTFFYNIANKNTMDPSEIDRAADVIRSNCFILKLDHKEIKEIILALVTENTAVADHKIITMAVLLDYISCFLSSDKQKKMTDAVIVNVLTNIWIGPGKNFAGITSIECLPVFLTLCESCYGDKTFKFSRLAGILSKDTRSVDKKNFTSTMATNFKYI